MTATPLDDAFALLERQVLAGVMEGVEEDLGLGLVRRGMPVGCASWCPHASPAFVHSART